MAVWCSGSVSWMDRSSSVLEEIATYRNPYQYVAKCGGDIPKTYLLAYDLDNSICYSTLYAVF